MFDRLPIPNNFEDPYADKYAYGEAIDEAYDRLETKWRKETEDSFVDSIICQITDRSNDRTLSGELIPYVEGFVRTLPTEILDRLAPDFYIDSLSTEAIRDVEERESLTREDFL